MKLVYNHVSNESPIKTVMNISDNTIFIYDYISSYNYGSTDTSVTANTFLDAIRGMVGDITVRINSKGGEVSNALAIYQLLVEHQGEVTCVVDGYAYSSAAWVLLAGAKREINTGGMVAIHNPVMYVDFDGPECLNEYLPQWTAHRDSIVSIIESRTGLEKTVIENMMNETTFMTAQQAVDNKFCTAIRKAGASVSDTVRNSLPDKLRDSLPNEKPDYSNLLQKSVMVSASNLLQKRKIIS